MEKYELEQLKKLTDPSKTKDVVQSFGLSAWIVADYKGTMEMATGSGKSKIGVLAIKHIFKIEPDAIAYICVPTETLRDVEWPAEIKKWWKDAPMDRIKLICHASMGEEVVNGEVALCVFDEIHHITPSNGAFFHNNKVWKVLGLTATEPNRYSINMSEVEKAGMIAGLAPVVFRVSIEEAIALKLVSDFEVVILKFDLDSVNLTINTGTDKKPVMTTEAARYKHLSKTLGKSMYSGNDAWKFKSMGLRTQFLKNLPSKSKLAKEIMKEIISDDTRTLIFCGSIEQAEALCGKWVYHSKGDDTQLKRFASKKINFLGAVMALNEPLFSINLSNCWNVLRA